MRTRMVPRLRIHPWVWWVVALALGGMALLPLRAQAQAYGGVFPGGSGSGAAASATPDPTREDVAAGYMATGAGGYGFTGQSSLGSCGSVRLVWLAPSNELRLCDGGRWRKVWTDEDGVTASPDRDLPSHTFVSSAGNGEFAFKANNRPIWDFGDGINDQCVSTGGTVDCASWRFGDVSTDVIGNRSTNTNVVFIAPGIQFLTSGSVCGASNTRTLWADGTDGNRPRWCDGTAAYRISRVVTQTVTFDFPSVPNASCTTADVTVPGAALGDIISVNADFALPATVGIGNVRTTATNTVTLRLCNHDPTTSADPASGPYRFRLER